jgi:hypothetical protein
MSFRRKSQVRYAVLLMCGIALLVGSSLPAKASSIPYSVWGSFSNGQQLSGQVAWNTVTRRITGYTLSLSSTVGPASCALPFGLCTFAPAQFSGTGALAGSSLWLAGIFNPKLPTFVLTIYGPNGLSVLTTKLAWSTPVSMPEGPAEAELLVVLAAMGCLLPFSPLLRRRHQT